VGKKNEKRAPDPLTGDWAKPVDSTGWPAVASEPRGIRPKAWIRDQRGRVWLRKEPRTSRPFEPAVELAMLRVASSLGIETATARLTSWRTQEGLKRGLLVLRFDFGPAEELWHGAEFLAEHHPGYDEGDRAGHTLERVQTALDVVDNSDRKLRSRLARMLAFDAWIGNGDRHQSNWALIRGPSSLRLAPMYDPAACLASEILDGTSLLAREPSEAALDAYIQKCPSGFGDGTKLIGQVDAVQALLRWPQWTNYVRGWVADFCRGLESAKDFLGSLSDSWLPPQRKALAARLLDRRLLWLQEVTDDCR